MVVDVYFFVGVKNKKLFVLLELIRYWRGIEDFEMGELFFFLCVCDSFFLNNDYILVKVDVRGMGVFYGKCFGEYSLIEVCDVVYIVDWVVN